MPEDPGTPAAPAAPEAPAQEPTPTDWKAEARKWEQRAKENHAKLEEAKPRLAEFDALIEASKSDAERLTEQATRWQNETQTWRKAAVSARIEALAATDFEYPADAASKLDPEKYLDAGGQIDEAAIRADLSAVLAERPTWARASTDASRVPAPNRSQGTSANGPAPVAARDQFAATFQQMVR